MTRTRLQNTRDELTATAADLAQLAISGEHARAFHLAPTVHQYARDLELALLMHMRHEGWTLQDIGDLQQITSQSIYRRIERLSR